MLLGAFGVGPHYTLLARRGNSFPKNLAATHIARSGRPTMCCYGKGRRKSKEVKVTGVVSSLSFAFSECESQFMSPDFGPAIHIARFWASDDLVRWEGPQKKQRSEGDGSGVEFVVRVFYRVCRSRFVSRDRNSHGTILGVRQFTNIAIRPRKKWPGGFFRLRINVF